MQRSCFDTTTGSWVECPGNDSDQVSAVVQEEVAAEVAAVAWQVAVGQREAVRRMRGAIE